ncbi:MAG: hypothetical protein KFF50_05160 [Desulfatitalea sp.]|nr:hypothetical protein [Desulfatitalea sp.]
MGQGLVNMFMFERAEGAFLFVFLVVTMAGFLSWIFFARLTMARIEREMRADGLPRPASWDGIGYRALWYSHAMVLPIGIWNQPDDPLIDVPLVRRYAKRADIIRAWVFFVSMYLACFMLILYLLLFGIP